MQIISDFRDFYDYEFGKEGPVFRRITTEGPNKIEQFAILKSAGIQTVPNGKLKDIVGLEIENKIPNKFVIYEDLNVHCGAGKALLSIDTQPNMSGIPRWAKYSEKYASLFFPFNIGKSIRELVIGDIAVWLEYISYQDWKSNCGDGEINIIGIEKANRTPFLPNPLYAIDYVYNKEMWAVDFNIAPGMYYKIKNYLSPKQIYYEIKKYIK